MAHKSFSSQSLAVLSVTEARAEHLLDRIGAELYQPRGKQVFAYADPSGTASDVGPDFSQSRLPGAVFLDATGNWFRANSESAAPGLTIGSGGVEGGIDEAVGDTARAGLTAGYDHITQHDATGGDGRANQVHVAAFAAARLDGMVLSGTIGYAHARNHLARATGVGEAHSTFSSDAWFGGGQVAVPLSLSRIELTPIVGATAVHADRSSFGETGTVPAGFLIDAQGRAKTFVSPYARLSLGSQWMVQDGVTVHPQVQIGYRHDAAAAGQDFTLVAADGTQFAGNRLDLAKDTLTLGASVGVGTKRWGLTVGYNGERASGWHDNGVSASFKIAF